jgi:hypothetical protein
VQEKILNRVRDQDVSAYAVWVPMLWIDGKASVPQATKRFDDARVSQYWDSKGEMTRAYSSILKIDGPAWDVYLLFDRDAEWKGQPPIPIFWMDQLGLKNGKQFDGEKLAEQIRVFLNSNQKSP